MDKKYIWLFGENSGNTANNNSFYFWKEAVKESDEILKYFVLKKTKKHLELYRHLTDLEKTYIVWKNSIKHYQLYKCADMLLVSLSYKDVQPTKGGGALNAPVIYLQHGTTGIKKITYSGNSYNNHMFRFIVYNPKMMQLFQEENGFKEYQLYYAKVHPRYQELVKKQRAYKGEQNQILWFVTWREYFGNNPETKQFLRTIKRTIENEKLAHFLRNEKLTIKLCMHSLFTKEHKDYLRQALKDTNIEIADSSKIDVMDEMVKSRLLITDYSSLGFDFTFLEKPVVLFQPDRDAYLRKRGLYCSCEDMEENSIDTSSSLVKYIMKGDYSINSFFVERTPDDIDYDAVVDGIYTKELYKNLKKSQLQKIVFLGYNFFGRGGTISATKSLVEGLLEKGYLVELLSLKKTNRINNCEFPYGCIVKSIYVASKKSKKTILKRAMYLRDAHYSYLKYDSNKKYLIPYAGIGLKKYLQNIKAQTVVSTRETLHFFLHDTKSEFVKNKIYFFHTDANLIEEIYPGIMPKLDALQLEKCAFVTELNRKRYIEKLNFKSYKQYGVIGNALTSDSILPREEIKAPGKKEIYSGIYLTRISKDRVKDLNNVIEFGKYLKENKISTIRIHVYGTGDYVDQFEDLIFENDIDEYIFYKGLTQSPQLEIRKHDFTVDFSLNQSFGMSYIESTLNGSKVFAYPNYGSKEVLEEIPDAFITSFEDLVNKIHALEKVTDEELKRNFDMIMKKYSRKEVSDKFLDLLEK
jgi:CDP-glycerol glycerophosphotransferase (TagB/SpsB family)